MTGAEADTRFPIDVDKTGAIRSYRILEGAILIIEADSRIG